MPGSLQIAGSATGMIGGSKVVGPATITGANQECPTDTPVLAEGDNSISVPTGAVVMVFWPCSGLASIKIRTVEGDTGVFVSPTNPTVIAFDPNHLPTTVIINVGTAVPGSLSQIDFI